MKNMYTDATIENALAANPNFAICPFTLPPNLMTEWFCIKISLVGGQTINRSTVYAHIDGYVTM